MKYWDPLGMSTQAVLRLATQLLADIELEPEPVLAARRALLLSEYGPCVHLTRKAA